MFSLKSVYVISHIIDDVEFAKTKLDKIIYLIYRKKHPPFHYSWYNNVWVLRHRWHSWQLHKMIHLSFYSYPLKYHTIKLKGEVWSHKTSLTPPLFFSVNVFMCYRYRLCLYFYGFAVLTVVCFFLIYLIVPPFSLICYYRY